MAIAIIIEVKQLEEFNLVEDTKAMKVEFIIEEPKKMVVATMLIKYIEAKIIIIIEEFVRMEIIIL